jgi:hypothetical protein
MASPSTGNAGPMSQDKRSPSDFPTTPGVFDPVYNVPAPDDFDLGSSGAGDAFVAKLDASGAALADSTFLGATHRDVALGIAVDAGGTGIAVGGNGGTYVTGQTLSADYPSTVDAAEPTPGGDRDAFITKLKLRRHRLW